MSILGTLAAAALDAAAAALLGWTTWRAVQARERPSALPFVAVSGALTVWAVCALGAELPGMTDGGFLAATFDLGQFGLALLVPVPLTVYALSYTGRGTGFTLRRGLLVVLYVLPIALAIVAIAVRPPTPVAERILASLLGTEILYLLVLSLYATYLLVGLGRSHDRIPDLQMPVVLGAVAAPYVCGVVLGGGPVADGMTVGLLASGGLLAVGLRRYPLLTGFPKAGHVARTRVVEALQEAVVVVDWDDHVLDANERAATLFDMAPEAMIGEPITTVVDGIAGSDLSAGATGTVGLRTTDGRRQFRFSVSAVDGAATGEKAERAPVARAVVLRDVTDRQTREQRLAVLNRVLRHNVRNELDVVLAHADRVDDNAVRDAIRDSATDLVALGDKARAAEAIMTASTAPPERVDLAAVATEVVEQYRDEYPASELSLTCPDELTRRTHRAVVRQVLTELVENALVHADGAARVDVAVRATADGTAELAVADDGPGIPDRERAILAEGAETQLEHGRGIGLWLVNWSVAQIGGELDIGENDPSGTVVTVRLHGTERE